MKQVSVCPVCGKAHLSDVKVICAAGAIKELPAALSGLRSKKPFILCDKNTYKAAGRAVTEILKSAEFTYTLFTFPYERVEPAEKAVGSAMLHFDTSCDAVVAVGSGVINDISKILSNLTGLPYIIVGTAPSMDGYASTTSSMARSGLKVSLPSKPADIIIGDIDILKAAPKELLQAGFGDMLAKYISICEWKIANIITGEYICTDIASSVDKSLKLCADNVEGLLKGDDAAVGAVFGGLVDCGLAMGYAGVSRPASGVEHYFSHVWDMRALAFGTPEQLHGLQCGVGTLYALKLYEALREIIPDTKKAEHYVAAFDIEKWNDTLTEFFGSGAPALIEQEKKEKKYDAAAHKERIRHIAAHWGEILAIIDTLPKYGDVLKMMQSIGMPTECSDLGIDKNILPLTFKATKDIRYKYVLSHLCWDLGILDEMADLLK